MIRCIDCDDEPLALKQMENYIEKTPYLGFLKAFDNALQAIPYLDEHEFNLMFFDINMPDITGMDFINH